VHGAALLCVMIALCQRMTAVTNFKRTRATLYPIAIVLLADVADIGHPFEGLKDNNNIAFFSMDTFLGFVSTNCDGIIFRAIRTMTT
jgi:hypothetical protein